MATHSEASTAEDTLDTGIDEETTSTVEHDEIDDDVIAGYWAEFTAKEGDVTPADEEPDQAEEPEPAEEPAQSDDQVKVEQAVAQVTATKKGNKNYIDNDLINSIEDAEVRQKVWNLANTAQSHYHRVYAKEREVSDLRQQLARIEAERAIEAQGGGQAKPSAPDSARIERLKRDYPDLAESIQDMFTQQLDGRTRELRELIDKSVVPLRERYDDDSRQAELSQLEDAANSIFHTPTTGITYREVVASPDFHSWLQGQDESIRTLAKSERAAEVITALKSFESDYSREYQKAYGQSWIDAVAKNNPAKKPSSADPASNPESAERARNIKEQRVVRKKSAVSGVSPSRQPTSDSASVDAEAYFNKFAQQSRYARKR